MAGVQSARKLITYAFQAFAIFSIGIEVFLLFGKHYLSKTDDIVTTNLQVLGFIGQLPIKDVKLYKDEATLVAKQKQAIDLFWSPGFKGYCSLDGQFTTACRNEKASNVDPEPPRVYKRWRGGVYFTIKRFQEGDFKRKRDTEHCPDGWKDCGLNFCVKQYEVCPVHSLKIDVPEHFANRTEIDTQDVKDGKVLAIERSQNSPKLASFLNDIIVTMNTLPCRSRNFNGTKKSTETTLDLFGQVRQVCDDAHPELLNNYQIIDSMNRNKFNDFNMQADYSKALPKSEALKYKGDEMLLSGSIYSVQSTSEQCSKVSVIDFGQMVEGHSNNHARLRSFFYAKAIILVLLLLLPKTPVLLLGCVIGVVYNFLLMTERTHVEYFGQFYLDFVQTQHCFFNLGHFGTAAEAVIAGPLSVISTSMFKNGLITYAVFLVIFLVLAFVGGSAKPATTTPRTSAQPVSAQKDKDEGDVARNSVPSSPELDPLARSARESKKVRRD